MRVTRLVGIAIGVSALLVSGTAPAVAETRQASGAAGAEALGSQGVHAPRKGPLRSVAPKGFAIGAAAAGGGHHLEQDYPDPFTHDKKYREVLARHFNSLTPENQLKWEFVHPARNRYNFGPADAIVRFAQQHGQKVRGHTLLWHSQNPKWLTEGKFSKKELRKILKDHITTVVGRYRGKIHQWDVANEIFDDNGKYRTQENIWLRTFGPDIIADAFRWAHQADPKAKLFLNDYGAEGINARSNAYLKLLKDLRKKKVPVHGFGVQGHLSLAYDFPADMAKNLKRFDDAGFETAITEVDVRIPLNGGTISDAELRRQADYYRQALEACLSVRRCNSFTVWGTTNRYSWVPVFFPDEGEATIFTDDFERKYAYTALQETLAKARRR